MLIIKRALQDKILSRMRAGKVIVLTSARRTGKTVLTKEVIKNLPGGYLYLKR